MQHSVANIQEMLARAVAAHQAGNFDLAEVLYNQVLKADRKQFDALHMLGVIEGQRGNYSAGLRRLKDALRIRPNAPDALINLGWMQNELGDAAAAIASYKKVLALNPRSALAHNNLCVVLRRQGRAEEALESCDAAIATARDYSDAWNNRGNVLYDLNRLDDALASYDRAIEIQPRHAQAHLGRGNVLHKLKRYDAALAAYQSALALRPDQAESHYGLGNVLYQLMRRDEALAAYDKALALKREDADFHMARGNVLYQLRRPSEALAAYDRALALKSDLPYAEGARLYTKLQLCDWDSLEAERAHLAAAIGHGARASDPFRLLAMSDSPADQMKCAELYVADQYPASAQLLWRGEYYRHERIRLAYISADFRNHAIAFLAAGLFEAHDRSRFETTAVSIGPDTDDQMQVRLRGAFDRFLDVRTAGDREIAEILRDLEIDIAVDLTGFTEGSRPAVLAQRCAPVQVSYLGYPGTMGASYVDYILADRVVVPPEHAGFYTEKIVRLPDTYQVNDAGRHIAEPTPTRDELQLPNEGFVFCCFNNSYKIGPPVFDIWMRLLQAVDGSALWLLDENEASSRNLRLAAERRGVEPARLVFAPRCPPAEHLARHRQADLLLDTLPYNAHTTASDALWAGVPVVTCLGSTFAGRVAASLLHAVGLPELVTASAQDYEALAMKIASAPALCASLKDKLARNRKVFPLFDTTRFTRHIEAAYTTMWQRYQRGELPQSFAVDPE